MGDSQGLLSIGIYMDGRSEGISDSQCLIGIFQILFTFLKIDKQEIKVPFKQLYCHTRYRIGLMQSGGDAHG